MPGPKPTPVESDMHLPKQVDVVVIGGGIIGSCTALELAERGISVLLCEKGQIAGEQSSRNWGWVRLGMRDPREIPLMQQALHLWQGMDGRIGRKTGYSRSGIVFGASGARSQGHLDRWLQNVDGMQTGAKLVSGAELDALLPGNTDGFDCGLYMPQDGRAEPQWAAPAIAEAARDRGAAIMTNCAVRSLDMQAGRVAGVFTERGRVGCARVVLAGGAWSRLFAGNAGIDLPQLKVLNTDGFDCGLYMPQDGRAEPQWAAPAIAEAARDRGAAIMTNCAVRSLDMQAGRVAGVFTERGRVGCARVVLAGGAWSRLFAGNAGIDLPQLKVLNTVMRTSPVEDGPEVALWSDRFAIRKRADGGYTIASGHENTVDVVPDSFRLARQFLPAFRQEWRSLRFRLSGRWAVEAGQDRKWLPTDVTPFEHCRVLDPEPSKRVLRQAWASARKGFPALQRAEIVQSWAGLIDVTPDAVPIISDVDQIPGLVIATGFSGHGFGIGPGAGRLAADLVTQTSPCVDPAAFRLSRFTDGSEVRPDPGY